MTQSERIIGRFGGQTRLAQALGLNQSVVAGWKARGVIPSARHGDVLRAAKIQGVDLEPVDFFDPADIAPSPADQSCEAA